jgi:hypothetical protein
VLLLAVLDRVQPVRRGDGARAEAVVPEVLAVPVPEEVVVLVNDEAVSL